MAYMHPAATEHLRKRWMRPDAYRFAAPGTPEAKPPGYLHPWAEVARAEDEAKAAAEEDAKAAFATKVKMLQASQDRLWAMLAEVKYELAWRRLRHKYSPDQPRMPAGNSDGGQWTSGGGGAGRETSRTELTQVIRICMAGSSSIGTDRWGNQNYWADYMCADGHSFRKYGLGGKVPAFVIDPRF